MIREERTVIWFVHGTDGRAFVRRSSEHWPMIQTGDVVCNESSWAEPMVENLDLDLPAMSVPCER